MTDAQTVERGILRAVARLVLIGALLGIVAFTVYQFYVHSEGYQDRKGQQELIDRLEGRR